LTAQPSEIRSIIDTTIKEATVEPKAITQVGIKLMKFCAKHDLVKVGEQVQSYSEPLNARYVCN